MKAFSIMMQCNWLQCHSSDWKCQVHHSIMINYIQFQKNKSLNFLKVKGRINSIVGFLLVTLIKSYGGGGLFLIIDNLLNALYLPKPLLQCAKINLFPFISAPDRYFHRKNRHQRSNPPKLVVHPLEPFHCIPWSVSSFVLPSLPYHVDAICLYLNIRNKEDRWSYISLSDALLGASFDHIPTHSKSKHFQYVTFKYVPTLLSASFVKYPFSLCSRGRQSSIILIKCM